ncbi:MAG TPA: putative glycoside hydrolase, partial [Solirubrobacteraceae bacterium]
MSQEATRYHYMVLAGNEHWLVPILHAINPNLKILLYQSIMHTNANDYSYMQDVTGCTAYRADLAAHPDWFLRDQNGRLVNEPRTTAIFVLDVANPAYQVQCAVGATALAKQYGFDGVFWDVVVGRLDWEVNRGIRVAKYARAGSWLAAMTSALDYIAPALRRQGLLSIGNIAGTPNAAVWENWAGVLDGVEEESWTDGGLGAAQQAPFWSTKLAELAWTQANGKYELVHSYSGSEAANTYGLASMLLAANGDASYSTS